jgi:hypothetical protein
VCLKLKQYLKYKKILLMKKMFILSLSLVLLSAAVSAQQANTGDRFRKNRITNGVHNYQLTKPEMRQLHRDRTHYKIIHRRAHRDGVVRPIERRRLHHLRVHDRRQAFRFKHNRHHRVI